MTLMRRPRGGSPFDEMVDWLTDDPWQALDRWRTRYGGATLPAVDVRETDDAYVVDAELPGVKPDDLDVTLDGRTLVIRAQYGTQREDDQGSGRWMVRERTNGTFARAITLPAAVDADHVDSTFENGELRLKLPKANESRTKRIQVGQGSSDRARQVGAGTGREPTK